MQKWEKNYGLWLRLASGLGSVVDIDSHTIDPVHVPTASLKNVRLKLKLSQTIITLILMALVSRTFQFSSRPAFRRYHPEIFGTVCHGPDSLPSPTNNVEAPKEMLCTD